MAQVASRIKGARSSSSVRSSTTTAIRVLVLVARRRRRRTTTTVVGSSSSSACWWWSRLFFCLTFFVWTVPVRAFQTPSIATTRPQRQQQQRFHSLNAATTRDDSSDDGDDDDDARGAALRLHDVTIYRGPARIVDAVRWRVEPGQTWALLGANGAGKSTLLQAIAGDVSCDQHQGRIVLGGGGSAGAGSNKQDNTSNKLGYLRQTAVAGSELTVFEEASAGLTAIRQAEQAMQRAQAADDWEALERATAQFEACGGYRREATVAGVLNGLGFSAATDFDTPCSALSGGWQMRVALARLLLSAPTTTLALLDEPGNHLDAAAKQWLARYLRDYSTRNNSKNNSNKGGGGGGGALILVTHDVALLESVQHIAELVPSPTGSRLQIYKSCNYQQYLRVKEERSAAALAEYQRNLEKAAKLQAFVDRFGASATKASSAQSRVKQLEKMRRDGLLEAPPTAIAATTAATTRQQLRPTLPLPDPPSKPPGNVLLSLKNANLGYDNNATPLVSNVNLEITPGMKLLIRGPNGSGKSTTLHSLRGTLPLLSGELYTNPDVQLGVFTQDLAQELDPNAIAVDLVTAYARTGRGGNIAVSDQQTRSCLGRLGLPGDKAVRRLRDLSGGEKARVALGMFALKASHVYLLDEPSNHLDAECVDALSEALREWGGNNSSNNKKHGGALVVVSHDRSFCERIPFTHVATVENGTLRIEPRGTRPSDWVVDGLSKTTTAVTSSGAVEREANGATTTPTKIAKQNIDPSLRKQVFNAPKRIAKLETLIEQAETKIAALDGEMLANGSDVGLLVDLNEEKTKLEADVEKYTTEWSELEEVLAHAAV